MGKRWASVLSAVGTVCWMVVAATASAQGEGVEMALRGEATGQRGAPWQASGVMYRVQGADGLVPSPGAEVVFEFVEHPGGREEPRVIASEEVRAGRDGRFAVSLMVPTANRGRLTLRARAAGREFPIAFRFSASLHADVLTDRVQYQPGETLHAMARLIGATSRRPRAGVHGQVQIQGPGGRLLSQAVQTGDGGVAHVSVPLPDGAAEGNYTVRFSFHAGDEGTNAQRVVRVTRRTPERILLATELTERVIRPGRILSVALSATTPDGTPIAGASVQASVSGAHSNTVTDDEGHATVRIEAPAYLADGVATYSLAIVVRHEAHGAAQTRVGFLVSRTDVVTTAVAAHHALVPDVRQSVFITANDPAGAPIAAGTPVTVTGPAVVGGRFEGPLGEGGVVAVPVAPTSAMAAPVEGSACAGPAVALAITVDTGRAWGSTACVPVRRHLELAFEVGDPVVPPGSRLSLALARGPAASRAPIWIEAIAAGRIVASTVTSGNDRNATITLPDDIVGMVQLRARAQRSTDTRTPVTQEGSVGFGPSTHGAVLVRPADAFALVASPAQPRYEVGQEATLHFDAAPAARGAHMTWVARDVALLAGEPPYTLGWVGAALDRALASEPGQRSALVRLALIAALPIVDRPRGAEGRDRAPWDPGPRGTTPEGDGALRDPVARRGALRRTGWARLLTALEARLAAASGSGRVSGAYFTARGGRIGLTSDVFEAMVENRDLPDAVAKGLGESRLHAADLRAIAPAFTIDQAACRITRSRYLSTWAAISAANDPDRPELLRRMQAIPPERWLGTLLELEMIDESSLRDGWGRTMVYRAARGRPAIVASERAPTWELVSAGPDGRVGTGDDVRDPFARCVPESSLYAIVSGENQLMRALADLAPGTSLLARMRAAFDVLSLASIDALREGPVSATATEGVYDFAEDEAAEMDGMPSPAAMGLGGLGTVGHGGGAGSGYGRGMGSLSSRSGRRRAVAAPAPPPMAAMSGYIREDFPATLRFVPYATLEGARTSATLPLADAVTTYRIEAIAWTESGFTTTAQTEIEVDRAATVDTPVPPVARTGDSLRMPVRVQNRRPTPIEVVAHLRVEGIEATPGGGIRMQVGPREAAVGTVSLRLGDTPGEGHVLVSLALADGTVLDAVRRPLAVRARGRRVESTHQRVVMGPRDAVEIAVPDDASAADDGELHLAVGADAFPEISGGGRTQVATRAWIAAFAGRAPEASDIDRMRNFVRAQDPRPDLRIAMPDHDAALAIGALYGQADVEDAVLERLLASAMRGVPARGDEVTEERAAALAIRLIALAPAARARGQRDAFDAAFAEPLGRLRQAVADGGAAATAGDRFAAVAAALAMSEPGGASPRARLALNEAARFAFGVGGRRYLDDSRAPGTAQGRLAPTALLALAHLSMGQRDEAGPALRGLMALSPRAGGAPLHTLWLLRAAFAPLRSETPFAASLDGRPVALNEAGTGSLEGLGSPGTHRLAFDGDANGMAWFSARARYVRPWSAAPAREAGARLRITGEVGARDRRSALVLHVQHRGLRTLRRPVVEIALPAGAELDEPSKAVLRRYAAGVPVVDDTVLRIPLRPLAPRQRVDLPLRLRWSVSGALHGLGATLVDAAAPAVDGPPATSILEARVVEIDDDGPPLPDPELDDPDDEPVPPPMPILPIRPRTEVSR